MHVHSIEAGLDLVNHQSEIIATTFKELGRIYWPGPITLVSQANLNKVPMLITADTGFIGIRVPQHPIALKLLQTSKVPIAAPSANKFGHVSPTKAEHVYNDFY